MICPECQSAADTGQSHANCPGGTWCDCQHGLKMDFTPPKAPHDDNRWNPARLVSWTHESVTHG